MPLLLAHAAAHASRKRQACAFCLSLQVGHNAGRDPAPKLASRRVQDDILRRLAGLRQKQGQSFAWSYVL